MIEKKAKPYTKVEILKSLQELPEDATVADAIEWLEFIKLIEERILEAEARPEKLIPQEEAKRRLAKWL